MAGLGNENKRAVKPMVRKPCLPRSHRVSLLKRPLRQRACLHGGRGTSVCFTSSPGGRDRQAGQSTTGVGKTGHPCSVPGRALSEARSLPSGDLSTNRGTSDSNGKSTRRHIHINCFGNADKEASDPAWGKWVWGKAETKTW